MNYGAAVDLENTVFEVGKLVEDGLHTAGLGVGEEHLAETVAADKGDELLDTQHVELVENIVEQQYRLLTQQVEQILELCELECQRETLLLPLGAETLDRHVAGEHEEEVVLVGAAGGVLRIAVGLPGGIELLGEGALVALIADGAGLVAAGNAVVILLEQRHEHLDKARAGGIERLAVLDELRIPEDHHGLIPLAVVPHLLEQAVALLESLIILYKVLEILAVGLRNDTVDELATEVAAAGDELLVVGRHHDEGELADMRRERLVDLLVPAHLLALATPEDATGDIGAVMAVDGEELLADADVLHIDRVEIALAEREIVDGVEEVGLAGTVVAHEAVDLGAEGDLDLGVVLEVGEGKAVESHVNQLLRVKFSTAAATSSMSQRGVEVAPLMPTEAAPRSQAGCTSAALPMRWVRGCTLRQYS